MIRAAILCATLLCPSAVQAQTDATFGQAPGLRDTPRAIEIFSNVAGYAEFTAERHGTPLRPLATGLGTDLLMRMFRNICLGIERGAALDDVMPDGFAPYASLPYTLGDVTAPDLTPGNRVLSVTGSIDADEDNHHPFIWLDPEATGMTCRLEWHPGDDVPEDHQNTIAQFFDVWVPWQFALVHASRPFFGGPQALTNATEWDRPCSDRWCPMTITYSFPDGWISIDTTLNITDIQGSRP